MFRRAPTKVQRIMIALMVVVYVALTIWLYPEVLGILSPALEDTFSEWVFDTSGWIFWSITVFHFLAGAVFLWSAGHFIEGRIRRRKIERNQ